MDEIKTIYNTFMHEQFVIDDHDKTKTQLEGIVIFYNKDKGCAQILSARYQCLNRLYINECDKMHLSALSIGGVYWGKPSSEGIRKYNNSCIFEGGKIFCIVTKDEIFFDNGSIKNEFELFDDFIDYINSKEVVLC